MECLKKWSHSVERILILGCGLHEPFTMGRSDGCEGLSPRFSTLIWYSFLSMALVANRLKYGFFHSDWIVVLNCFMIIVKKTQLFLTTKEVAFDY